MRAICCSWSGGKDSCLALWKTLERGDARLVCLVTMLTEDGCRSRSHGLHVEVLEAQARAIGVPLLTAAATWEDYEQAFVKLLLRARAIGAEEAVFGDIDIPAHRAWEESVARQAGLTARLPLWQADRMDILESWWAAGFAARLVVVREGIVGRGFLSRLLDRDTAQSLAALGIDPCGENGEFHTLVTDGPLFRDKLDLVWLGQASRADCWAQDVRIGTSSAEFGGREDAPWTAPAATRTKSTTP
jgi:diphthine-ammonia ligase